MPAERLQKIIAAAGIASRRKAEELITGGLVSVNGQIVTELGSKADPESDHIRVNGKLLHGPERHVYLLMNKPKGYVTTLRDPEATADRDGFAARRESASVSGRTPRLCQRRLPAADQRRRVGQSPDESRVPCSQNLYGEGRGQSDWRRVGRGCAKAFPFPPIAVKG